MPAPLPPSPETERLRAMYGGKCHVCGTKRGLTFHHRWYDEGQKKYSDFGRNTEGRKAYRREVERQVWANPRQFFLLCNLHHATAERLQRWKPKTLGSLIEVIKLTDLRTRNLHHPQLEGRLEPA